MVELLPVTFRCLDFGSKKIFFVKEKSSSNFDDEKLKKIKSSTKREQIIEEIMEL